MGVLTSRTPKGQLEGPLDQGVAITEDGPLVVGQGLAVPVVPHDLEA